MARRSLPLLAGLAVQAGTAYLTLVLAGRLLGAATFGTISVLYVLVSRIFNSPQKSSERFEYFFRRFRPDKWSGVLVPHVRPGEDVLLELPDRLVDAAAQELLGQKPEPALYMVQPGRAGRREMNTEPRVFSEPFLNSRVLCVA